MILRNSPRSFGVVPSNLPTWLTTLNLSVNQWGEIPNSNVSAAQQSSWTAAGLIGSGGVSSIISAWEGMSVNSLTNTAYMLANGGHGDYYGNQAISCNFNANAPAWIEAAPPSDSSQVVITGTERTYLDGRPPSSHSYHANQFDEVNGLAMRFGTPGIAGGGGYGPPIILSFNPNTGLYNPDGTHPDFPFPVVADDCIFKDPATGRVWVYDNASLAYWDPLTNTCTSILSTVRQTLGGAMPVDTVNNRALYGKAAAGTATGPCTFDLTAHTYANVTFTGAAAASVNPAGAAMLFQTHASYGNRFLQARGGVGNAIVAIDADTFVATDLTTTGGSSIPAQLGAPNGIYNRFEYLQLLGGCVYVPTYSGNCWFLRTE